jgi:hypothetical protein
VVQELQAPAEPVEAEEAVELDSAVAEDEEPTE